MMPKIGIFWLYKGNVIGRSVSLVAGEESVPGLIDSPDTHTGVWAKDRTLLTGFPELRAQEYFSIPRGRVLWSEAEQHAIVYMDSTLFSAENKESISVFFDLGECDVRWRKDDHYTTRPEAVGALFDDEGC